MKILGYKITIVPASGHKVIHELEGDYKDTPLADVLKKAGLDLKKMQITDAEGKTVDPKLFKVTASSTFTKEEVGSKSKEPGFWATLFATERSSGS